MREERDAWRGRTERWAWLGVGLLCLWAGWRLGSLGVFLFDVGAADHAVSPRLRELDQEGVQKPFFPKHNCFTCYAVAVELAESGAENLYDPAHYRDPEHETAIHREIGDALHVDRYQYPPPFLLLPWALLRLGGGFFGARTLFFLLEIAAFTAALVWIGIRIRRADPRSEGWRTAIVWPLVLGTTTTLTSLQIGNVHPFVIVLSVLAILAFESRRVRLGGALLGFAVVSKIFPGILLVWLTGRRKWRAVAWTLAAIGVYALGAWWAFGSTPYRAFLASHLERLASGEAFGFAFHSTRAMLVNASVQGFVHRIGRLDAVGDVEGVARVVAWGYGVLLLIGVWVLARRGAQHHLSPRGQVLLGLALLTLAQLRSPFLPWGYGAFVVLWLTATLLATPGQGWKASLGLVGAWLWFATPLPLPYGPPSLAPDWAFGLGGTLLALVLAALAAWRAQVPTASSSPELMATPPGAAGSTTNH